MKENKKTQSIHMKVNLVLQNHIKQMAWEKKLSVNQFLTNIIESYIGHKLNKKL